MVRQIESPEDEMRGTVTYELDNGRFARFDARDVGLYGIKELLKRHGVEMPTERVPVFQHGREVGTLPGDFDPMFIKSLTFLYDPRSGDFRLVDGKWLAAKTLGPGDLAAIPGFQRTESN